MEADFGGWATKADVRCADGRTIMRGAFRHQDQTSVPLVYQHGHTDINNVLGHALLEDRGEGVYAHAYFNDTTQGQNAKELVRHGDIKYLSIFANQLKQGADKNVVHGTIREVSLVLAGANPKAVIDYVRIQHSIDPDDFTDSEEDAIIHTGLEIERSVNDNAEDEQTDKVEETKEEDLSHADGEDEPISDIFDSFTEKQKNVVYLMLSAAIENSANDNAQHSDDSDDESLTHQEGADDKMTHNLFDQTDKKDKNGGEEHVLTHDAIKGIFSDALRRGSLREATENYALQHGIENIDILFPDAKPVSGEIALEKRRTEWVASVINGTAHTPFSRIKTFSADLTQDEARAKGYIKGTYKEEEWFGVTKRSTSPTTIYKKQKVDRDDMLDITDFNMVDFLKGEMRLMLEEEFARAVLIGDGRNISDTDKIKDPAGAVDGVGLRSIINDHEFYVTTIYVNVDDADSSYEEVVDAVMDGMEYYKGTGTPNFYSTIPQINKFKKARDLNGQRYYKDNAAVAEALGVGAVYNVEPMKEIDDLIGIIVNLSDYNVGTDRGGEITMFDDFDIDYNQQKYLMETRASGALVRPKSAIVIRKVVAGDVLATPTKPAFNRTTGVITIPTVTGVDYKDSDGTTLTAGDQTALAAGESTTVNAVPKSGFYFSTNQNDSWEYKRPAA